MVLMEHEDTGTGTGEPFLLSGAPGRHFRHDSALPGIGPHLYDAEAIATDPVTGRVTVLAGAFLTAKLHGSYLWSLLPGRSWTGPSKIPVPVTDFSSLSVYANRIAIGVVLGLPSSLLTPGVIRRSARGHWIAAKRLPHSSEDADEVFVDVNPGSGHLHAVWAQASTKCQTGCEGILAERFINGHWSAPRRLANSAHDRVKALTFDSLGHVIAGYVQLT
jgi:hypothetical protein